MNHLKQDRELLGDSDLRNLSGPTRLSHLILWVTLALLIIAFFWAKFAVIDEYTRGEGKVIPSSQVQVIQNLEGGIVSKIFVKEGQIVTKGQILMQLDKTRFLSSYSEEKAKSAALQIKIARLTAQIENKPFNPPADAVKQFPDQVQFEMAAYKNWLAQLQQLKESYNLANKQLGMTAPLVSKGAVSPVEVLQLQRTVSDLKKQVLDFTSQALSDLNDAKAQLQVLQESMTADKDRLTRTTVISPVKGIVKTVKITTEGGVSQPGSDLMEIVPLEDTLLIEARIRPQDIGFLHPGQKAMVKITAYDFSIYGGLQGTLEQIGADTVKDEKGTTYYIVRVRTQKNYLGTRERPLYIIPGMVATVDIVTGKKSILDYILKPFIAAKENALRER